MQLIKENLFDAISSLKDCLYITEFMLANIMVKDNILDDEKYKYIFSVEKVNELVLEGMSFRDAYKKVAEMIENGSYQPVYEVRHTHEGSIGNLCNDKIIGKMNPIIGYFNEKYDRIQKILHQLIENSPHDS
jgi:argininosuccinate lyase